MDVLSYIALFVLSVSVSFLFYRKTLPYISKSRKSILLGLRTIVIYCLLLLLFNPILILKKKYDEKPTIILLIDKSNSMYQKIEGVEKYKYLENFVKQIERSALNSNYWFTKKDLFEMKPNQSILLEEINDVLQSDRQIKAIALASDGWFQDDPSIFRELTGVPFFTFDPNILNTNPNISIDNIYYNKNARKNETQPIRVSYIVESIKGEIKVTLKHDSLIIDEKTLILTNDRQQMDTLQPNSTSHASSSFSTEERGIIDFNVHFKDTGLKVLEIEISHIESETSTKGYAAIQVLDDKAKIMVLTDKFNWDIRVFNRTLNVSERFNSDLFYVQKGEITQKGKVVDPKWQDYSGIALFDDNNMKFSDKNVLAIKNMVLSGKGLIYFGNMNNDLQDLLPIRASNITLRNEGQTLLRPEALTYQIFRDIEPYWSKFPPVEYFYLNSKDQAIVLAEVLEQQRIPVIFLGNFGAGITLHFAFKGFWRGQFNIDTKIFENFINGLAHWIFSSKSDNFFTYTEKNAYYTGEKISVKLSAFDEKLNPLSNLNAKIEVKNEDRIVFFDFLTKTGDIFSINLPELPPGVYHYTIRDDINNREAKSEFEVLEQDIESLNKGFNKRLLSDISIISGGENLNINNITNFHFEKAEIKKKLKYIEIPLHKNVLFIVGFLLCFSLELFLRKKWKLL